MSYEMIKNKRASNRIWSVTALVLAALLTWIAVQTHRTAGAFAFPLSQMEIARADGTKASFRIEVATSPQQQERGLMFRKKLAPDAGMLFLWPQDQPVSMWMKNTVIPLDMLFVAHSGVITKVIANAVPYDLTPLSSDGLVRAVIEIGGGEAARKNIKVGDRVLYSAFVESTTKDVLK